MVFCCGKTAAATLYRVAAVFCCDRLCRSHPPWPADCPGGHSPQANWILLIDAVRWSGQNPEQPSIAVFGICHKSESLLSRLGLSRFDRRVQPNLSVLEDKWVALFCWSDSHKPVKEGCKWHPKKRRPGRRTFCDKSLRSLEGSLQRKTSIMLLAPKSRLTLVRGPEHWSLPGWSSPRKSNLRA